MKAFRTARLRKRIQRAERAEGFQGPSGSLDVRNSPGRILRDTPLSSHGSLSKFHKQGSSRPMLTVLPLRPPATLPFTCS